ncbi:MAG: oligosaccharide flippase family protein, partial [Bacteriovoracaceae bacterium]|nr:oligosaccharide flippase family protein [Bacteriovoracaceae bacterium]
EFVLIETLYLFVYRKEYREFFFKFSEISVLRIKSLFKASLPIMITLFLSNSIARIDQLMIGNLVSATELGKYAVAVKLVDVWQFLPFAIINTIFPIVVSRYNEGEASYKLISQKLYSCLVWISIGLGLGTYFIGEELIDFLYGKKYLGSGKLLVFYVWTTFFTFFLYVRTKVLTIEQALKVGVWVSLISLIANIALNFYLIPQMGAKGAIAASIFSYLLGTIIVALFSKTLRKHLWWYLCSVFYPIKQMFS